MNSGSNRDKGKGKEKQTPHPPERSGSVSEHLVHDANLPVTDSHLTHQGHHASYSVSQLTHQGYPASGSVPQRQQSVHFPTEVYNPFQDLGPHLMHQGNPVSGHHVPAANLQDSHSYLTHQGHPASGYGSVSQIQHSVPFTTEVHNPSHDSGSHPTQQGHNPPRVFSGSEPGSAKPLAHPNVKPGQNPIQHPPPKGHKG